jgi:hypothetical protein
VTPAEKHYLFVQSTIGSAIVNALLNGAIGWGITVGLTEFPVWKTPGVAADLIATAFGVAFGTSLGAVIQIRLDTARGKIAFPELSPALARIVGFFPRALLPRAVWFGLVAAVVFGPPALLALGLGSHAALDRTFFVGVKAGYSAIIGAAVTPFILLGTLASLPGRPRTG